MRKQVSIDTGQVKRRIAATLNGMKISAASPDDSVEDLLFKMCGVFVIQHNNYLKKTWEKYTAQEKIAHLVTCISAISFIAEESFDAEFEHIVPSYLERLEDFGNVDAKIAERALAAYRKMILAPAKAASPDELEIDPIFIGKSASAWLNTGNTQFIDLLPKLIFTQIPKYID